MTIPDRIVGTLKIADRTYDLMKDRCRHCGRDVFGVVRTCGMIISVYKFDHARVDDFEEFCREVDEDLHMRAPDLIDDFYRDLCEINSDDGIEADCTFEFRLLEYGRTRLSRLQKLGVERALRNPSEKLGKKGASVQAAFELGFAAGQHSANKHSEEFFWAGLQMAEARQVGQERARLALTSKGKKTRSALAKAAQEVRRRHPEIGHNIAAVAREIQKLRWPELCREDGSAIKEETICKYLREARKSNKQENGPENPDSGKSSR